MENQPEYHLIIENGKETGYYNFDPDGVSRMTVAALAKFCGVEQKAIGNLLKRIREVDPITNQLPKCLKLFTGMDLRLTTNDLQGRRIIPDDACYVIAEYYALDTRQYEGKKLQ